LAAAGASRHCSRRRQLIDTRNLLLSCGYGEDKGNREVEDSSMTYYITAEKQKSYNPEFPAFIG
jgi:hypothetical protein